MTMKYKYRSILAAVAVAVGIGTLAPLPAMAGGYGYGYEEPSYQPRYYKPRYERHCYYKRVKVYDEYAFVTTPGNKGWQKIEGAGEQLIKDEEQLPLSPNNFTDTDERQRRLFAGLIPVAKREAYMGAALSAAPSKNGNTGASTNVLPKTARKILFRTQVSEPWKRIIDRAVSMRNALAKVLLVASNSGASSHLIDFMGANLCLARS